MSLRVCELNMSQSKCEVVWRGEAWPCGPCLSTVGHSAVTAADHWPLSSITRRLRAGQCAQHVTSTVLFTPHGTRTHSSPEPSAVKWPN